MSDLRTAAQQALEAYSLHDYDFGKYMEALRAALAEPKQEPASKMTAGRAAYFMARFKREEKMLGPNEQAALDFVISMLEAALAEPVQAKSDHETRAEIAEQQVVQLAEERDHYRNLWLKAKQAEPVQEPVAWRYQDARGNYRYRGYVQGFDKEYSRLKPVPLYTAPPQRKENT